MLRTGTLVELYRPPTDRPYLYVRRLDWESPEDRQTYRELRLSSLKQTQRGTGSAELGRIPDEAAQRETLTQHPDGSGYWGLFIRFPRDDLEFCICSAALTTHQHRQTWGYDSDYWAECLSREFGIAGAQLETALSSTMYLNQLVGGASRKDAWRQFLEEHAITLPDSFALPDISEHVKKVRSAMTEAGLPANWWVGRDLSNRAMSSNERHLSPELLFDKSRLEEIFRRHHNSDFGHVDEQSRYYGTTMPTRYFMDFLATLTMTAFDRALIRIDVKATNKALTPYYVEAYRSVFAATMGENYRANLLEVLAWADRPPNVYCEDPLFTDTYNPYSHMDRFHAFSYVRDGMLYFAPPGYPTVTRTHRTDDGNGLDVCWSVELSNGAHTHLVGTLDMPYPHTDIRSLRRPDPDRTLSIPRHSKFWSILRDQLAAGTDLTAVELRVAKKLTKLRSKVRRKVLRKQRLPHSVVVDPSLVGRARSTDPTAARRYPDQPRRDRSPGR